MSVSIIVAMSENGVIGRGGGLPWRLSADLQRFKRLTMGHAIIMGRRTFESIGRLLPGRTSIVITRQAEYDGGGASIAHGLEEALRLAGDDAEKFVIGGGEVFQLALPLAERVYMTLVHASCPGETRFPSWRPQDWKLLDSQRRAADERNEYEHSFLVYERVQQGAQA